MNIKQKIKLKIIAVFLLQLFLILNYNGSFSVSAQGLNSNYKRLVNYSSNTLKSTGNSGSSFGQKSDYQPSKIIVKAKTKTLKAELLPSKFDLRDVGGVTDIKNQGEIGACWTFSSIASLESYEKYKNSVTKDYSELNMITNNGYDLSYDQGGNREMSIAYLSGWNGPVLESYDPYPNPATVSNITVRNNLPADMHLKDAVYLPQRSNYLDNSKIKEAVKNYGAVSTAMYIENGYYNSGTFAYYYPYSDGPALCNHAINIVGWDDNYSASNFYPYTPAGNGAFICRNSWGTSFGDSGYFYISYYDTSVANEGTVYIDESKNDYTANYSYDKYGLTNFMGNDSQTSYFANVYTANRNEKIDAASFYTVEEGAAYTISVIKNFNGSFSGMTQIKSGTLEYAGYHTVNISDIVDLNKYSKFAVIVKITNPSVTYNIPIEDKIDGYTSNASSDYGQSYISDDGVQFNDLKNISGYENANVCLKVFTNEYSAPEALSVSADVKGGTYYKDISITLNPSRAANIYYTLDGTEPSSGSIIYSSPISITGNKMLKFYAEDSQGYKSDSVTENYIIDKTPPAAPGNVKASAAYNSVKLTWSPVIGASGYEISRSASSSGTYTKVGDTAAAAFTNIGLITGTTYYYKVRAYKLNGLNKIYGNYSAAVSIKPLLSAPVSVKAVSASYNSTKISWGTVSGASGYQIFRAVSYFGTYSLIKTTSYLSYLNTGLTAGRTYYYKVRAYRIIGTSKVYSNNSVVVSARPIPSVPANLKAARVSSSRIKLTWRAVSGAYGYQIYRSTSRTGTYSLIKTTSYLYYTNTRLTRGRTYYYKVRAYRTVGRTRVYSNWAYIVSARP
jgi:C1A family cysteine protease/fibronectin type 3 domain-containing protein